MILDYLVPKPAGFFSRAGSRSCEPKSDFLKNSRFKLKYLNAPMTAQLNFDGGHSLMVGVAENYQILVGRSGRCKTELLMK